MKLNRVRRRRRDLLQIDRLIQLPNDVLLNILERVGTLDAIKTCVVSKRTQDLPAMLSQIVIVHSDLLELHRRNRDVVEVTDKILTTRSPLIPIRKLKLRFIMRGDDHLRIGRSVALAMASQQIIDEAEFEVLTKKHFRYTDDLPDPIYFAKQFNGFIGECPDAFAGLTRLYLQNLRFRDESDIANVLSTCERLESLSLCRLSQLLVNVPSVSNLHLDFRSEKIWIQPECHKLLAPLLGKLRLVTLDNLPEERDIAWTMFFLEGAPSLHELCITVWDHKCQSRSQKSKYEKSNVKWEPSVADFKHKSLARLTIHGFESDDYFTGYVTRILKVAVNIKEISLHDRKLCTMCKATLGLKVRPSRYPRTIDEEDSLRKKITQELVTSSSAVIHFRRPCY